MMPGLRAPSLTCMICQANHTQVQVCEAAKRAGGAEDGASSIETSI